MSKIIVFEGLDGCGKTTQIEKLKDYLKKNDINFKFLKFPNYECETAIPIKKYLSGEMEATPYQISAFFAIDRLNSYLNDWKKDYEAGTLIVMDRYLYSNFFLNGIKLKIPAEIEAYKNFFENFEFDLLKLPKPDVTLFLDIDPVFSQKLMSERYNGDESKKDINEKDVDFQLKCRDLAIDVANDKKWSVIKVSDKNAMRNREDIFDDILFELKNKGVLK